MPRPTPVGDAVRGLFEGGSRHSWSLTELHEAARRQVPSADYSSVFRAVVAMEREGYVARVEVGDGRARYEVREEHHEHVRCDGCGRVAEVSGCSLGDREAAVRQETGFVVTSHEVVFAGLCPECAAG